MKADREPEQLEIAPPVKKAPWKWQVPAYMWAGGVAAGGWLAAAAEDLAGEGERKVIRIGRYTALGGLLGGAALLIADLGRPERFPNMLRVVRPTSAMSIGSWGLTGFGLIVGAGVLLQAAEDGLFGDRPRLAELSRGGFGRAVHLAGLPPALFFGSYTGGLLASTSTPIWARRTRILPSLFLASGTSDGMAAVSLAATASRGVSVRSMRGLATTQAIALGAELAILAFEHLRPKLPSEREESWTLKAARILTIGAGVALPFVLAADSSRSSNRRAGLRVGRRVRRKRRARLLGDILTLAGGLALRYLTVHEGNRSAETPADTWPAVDRETAGRRSQRAPVHTRDDKRRSVTVLRSRETAAPVEVTGRITFLQEDRIRLVDAEGRGYLLVARKGSASLDQLEQWRDQRMRLRVTYSGLPDAGAFATRFVPVSRA